MPFDRAGGKLLFNVVAERYEKRSVLISTNLAFAEWVKVFGGDECQLDVLDDQLERFRTRRVRGGPEGGSERGGARVLRSVMREEYRNRCGQLAERGA